MDQEGLDSLLIYSWKRGPVRYVSGYYPNYIANVALVMLPAKGEPCMWIRFPFDLERAQRESWIEDVRASGNVPNMSRDAVEEIIRRRLDKGKIGLVTGDDTMEEMPFSFSHYLQANLPDATFVEANVIIRKLRIAKSEAEFSMLRKSARLADSGADRAVQIAHDGMSEHELVAHVESTLRKQGAGIQLVVVASKGDTELISPPTWGRSLETGNMVLVEIGQELNGYWTQVARTFCVGEPTPEQKAIYRAVYGAYQAAVEALIPGNVCRQVAEAIHAYLSAAGYDDHIEQDFGHGIGLDLPEPPRIELRDQTVIEPGLVMVIHPAIRVPGVGGAFIGGTVLVTESGTEKLHAIPEEL